MTFCVLGLMILCLVIIFWGKLSINFWGEMMALGVI